MPVLEMRGISKSFGAIQALQEVDFGIGAGEVVGLMGDNGAGKSTLVKIIAGNYPPSEGQIVLEGKPAHFHRPLDARQNGIEIVYQDLALCDNLTAAANVFLGREVKKSFGPLRFLDHGAMYTLAGKLFAGLKSETRPRDIVRQMSGGQRPFEMGYKAMFIVKDLVKGMKVEDPIYTGPGLHDGQRGHLPRPVSVG